MNEAVSKWRRVIFFMELERRSKTIVKVDGKQILLLLSDCVVFACKIDARMRVPAV